MTTKVHSGTNLLFLKETRGKGCTQRLRDLASSIKAYIVRFFQFICPCLFRKSTTSQMAEIKVQVQPALITPIRPQVRNTSFLQTPSTEQMPLASPNFHNLVHEHQKVIGKASQTSAEFEAMKRRATLKPRTMNTLRGVTQGDGTSSVSVSGTQSLAAAEIKGGVYVALTALDLFWLVFAQGMQFKGSDLDEVLTIGLGYLKKDRDSRNDTGQIGEILNRHFELALALKEDLPMREDRISVKRVIELLTNQMGKEEAQIWSAILATGTEADPTAYCLYIKKRLGSEGYDLYLIDPYGGGNGPICCQKFDFEGLVKYLNNSSGYSCLAIRNKA